MSGDVWRRVYTYEEASDSRQENVTLARVLGISKEHICIDDKYCVLGLSIRQFSSVSINVRFDELSFLFTRV